MEEKIKEKYPRFHKHFFTVTRFSKLLALGLFIILPFIGFYLGINYQKSLNYAQENLSMDNFQDIPEIDYEKQNNGQKQISEKREALFLPYSELNELASQKTLGTVNDPFLGVNFSYPSKYFMNSLLADANNLSATIFYLINRNSVKEESINNVLECEKDNRVDPIGICTESMGGDMQVNINIPDEESIDNFLNYESKYDKCKIETINQNKIVKSCTAQMSVDPDDIGMSYIVYLKDGDKKRFVSLNTRVPEAVTDLIKTIITSAKLSS